ncbi:Cytochrome P450 [Caenorhabditis elegans]|uniref:Cytochrome P450 n=1 Tax=Caenorhabditis elegans TaxID=6239 RepID=Q9N525_CAEEL|nr:Cytochrome P450 [Caenorhabditis elegans]CCD61789.1 Cytochrome P450 [Caenorhabditis elegans]|eukprot:NP_503130.2 CYtochrome P450 family [Caenorhabditis elegans]
MSLILPCLLIILLLFIVSFWKIMKNILKYRKYDDLLPGPPAHPIFGNTKTFSNKTTEEIFQALRDLFSEAVEKGQSLIRHRILGTFYVWPLDGKTVSKILESTTELDKGGPYEFFNDWLGGGTLLEGYGERWRSHRKMLTPTFHFAKLEGYFEVFNTESRVVVDCLDKFAKSGETVDLFPFFKRCTLDTICKTAMGAKVDAQLQNSHPYITAIEQALQLGVLYAMNPHHQIPAIYWALGHQKKKDEYFNIMKTFTRNVIAERRTARESGEVEKETSKRNMNFLDILLSNEESSVLSPEDLRQEVDTFMFAGHDTTTTSVSWVCWNLAHHPDIQQNVYEEIVSVFGEDPNEDVTTEGIKKLEYTERMLKESKRICPTVPAVLRQLISDMEIGGVLIPAGANVAIAPMAIHKNANIYQNPDIFDPDRFLPEETAKRHAYDFIPFSAGLRNCIGQKFAQLNEKVMVIHLLKNFKIEPMGGYYSTKQVFEPVGKPSNGIPVRLVRRL